MDKLDFGKELIKVRKARGLTQSEVAARCNVTIRTIQRIESGGVMPRSATVRIISESLGVDFFEPSNQNSKSTGHAIFWYVKDLFNFKTNAMKKISILSTSVLVLALICVNIFSTDAQSKTSEKEQKTVAESQDRKVDFARDFDGFEIKGNLVFVTKDSKHGLFKRDGKRIIPCEYDRRLKIDDGFILVTKGNKVGLMNLDGETIIPCEYDGFEGGGNLIYTIKNNKHGLMNLQGETIVPSEFDRLEIEGSFVFTLKGNKRGLMNLDSETIIPCEYDSFKIEKSFVFMSKANKHGLMNLDGQVLIPCEYHRFEVEDNFVFVSKYNKQGLMNLDGETVIACEYDTIKIDGSTAIVTKNGTTSHIRI